MLLNLSGKPSTISFVLFLDSENASSVQDVAHSGSILDDEAVDLGSNPSLWRVTLGKVNSEDLSPHLQDRENDHCFTPWGVHEVIGAAHVLRSSLSLFCISRSFS